MIDGWLGWASTGDHTSGGERSYEHQGVPMPSYPQPGHHVPPHSDVPPVPLPTPVEPPHDVPPVPMPTPIEPPYIDPNAELAEIIAGAIDNHRSTLVDEITAAVAPLLHRNVPAEATVVRDALEQLEVTGDALRKLLAALTGADNDAGEGEGEGDSDKPYPLPGPTDPAEDDCGTGEGESLADIPVDEDPATIQRIVGAMSMTGQYRR